VSAAFAAAGTAIEPAVPVVRMVHRCRDLFMEELRMNREDLVLLCERFAGRRTGVVTGRVRLDDTHDLVDPVPEILRSFRRAEISESEKNALVSLVCDPEEDADVIAEQACICDPFADEQACDDDD
jgi:hypothetical protein